ncbi:hypothetical protein LDI01_09170 [Lentilactobacillus diolivorans]|uniref:Uncharacterized protein n=2 Tax=Lentilactobacillus diolivorans TaxID=179838 RepID=A0A0R1SCZ8_9LACO|nr:hypothetical protein FC85_GL002828 [Lentilactobacillus diolivorans DSM 14421]GEP23324.1 hypothetical protein LDI01_09170 [Lentilactobacillus diolivorans]
MMIPPLSQLREKTSKLLHAVSQMAMTDNNDVTIVNNEMSTMNVGMNGTKINPSAGIMCQIAVHFEV